ncbi:MAG: helix-hairpin-helix domain-containing protein [Candidatus Dojkabacteria bacterium]|jgi:competence protein ComEA
MENVLQKKNIIKQIIFCLGTFLLGVLFDHFVLYPYFNFPKGDVKEVQESETNIPEQIAVSSTLEDKKITIEKTCNLYVDTSGAVKQPGVFCLEEGSMVIDAITKAGGFTNTAAYRFVARRINLSQKLVNNQKIYIPFEEEMECKILSFLPQTKQVETMVSNTSTIPLPTSEIEESTDTVTEDSSSCVNINNDSLEKLDSLPGIGPVMAQKIIDGRPYEKIEDLLNVSGIGESLFSKIKNQICI